MHLLTNNAWWAVVMSRDVPNSLRLTVALAVALALIAIWRLLRPGQVRWLPWDAAARQRLALLGGTIPPAKADGVVLGEAERAGIPFRRCGRVLLGLGDPMGAEGDRVSAIWRLRDLAQQEGLDPAFWRAGPRPAEGLRRSGPDRAAAGPGRAAAAGDRRTRRRGAAVPGVRGRDGT